MAPLRHTLRRTIPVLLAAALAFLAAGSTLAAGAEQYWELPRVVASARFPQIVALGDEPLLFWQESRATGADSGEAWVSLARRTRDAASSLTLPRFAGPFPYSGIEPVLYAAVAAGRTVLVAGSATERSVSIYRSIDGGSSFAPPVEVGADYPLVAPRLFPRADGGWLLFATAGGGLA